MLFGEHALSRDIVTILQTSVVLPASCQDINICRPCLLSTGDLHRFHAEVSVNMPMGAKGSIAQHCCSADTECSRSCVGEECIGTHA